MPGDIRFMRLALLKSLFVDLLNTSRELSSSYSSPWPSGPVGLVSGWAGWTDRSERSVGLLLHLVQVDLVALAEEQHRHLEQQSLIVWSGSCCCSCVCVCVCVGVCVGVWVCVGVEREIERVKISGLGFGRLEYETKVAAKKNWPKNQLIYFFGSRFSGLGWMWH